MYSKKEIFKKVVMENTDYDKGISVNELKSILDRIKANISRASVYNYINRSIDEGIIEKRDGKIFYVGEKLLNNHEARFIADAILSSRILTKKKTQLLLEKISKICGKNAFKNILESYDEFCNYQPSPKATNEEVFYVLSNILSAKSNYHKISFKYKYYNVYKELEYKIDEKTKQEKVYVVSPYCLLWQNDNYYLLAYDDVDKKIKHFRIDRMVSCKEIDDEAVKVTSLKDFEKGMDINDYLMKCFNMFGNQYDDKEVRVKLICERKQGIINKFIDKFGQDLKIYPENEEKMTVIFNAFPSEGLLIWLMQFGPSIEVIKPKSLRNKIKELIMQMVDIYKKEQFI